MQNPADLKKNLFPHFLLVPGSECDPAPAASFDAGLIIVARPWSVLFRSP
jgi:hypothetical protein